jgi:hypothetical protein
VIAKDHFPVRLLDVGRTGISLDAEQRIIIDGRVQII